MTTATRTAITAEEARELMVRAIEERGGDFVYRRYSVEDLPGPVCRYQKDDGSPDCLIGLMMSYVGRVPENDAGGAAGVVRQQFPDTEIAVVLALDEAQSAQDAGKPWSEALVQFDWRLALERQQGR